MTIYNAVFIFHLLRLLAIIGHRQKDTEPPHEADKEFYLRCGSSFCFDNYESLIHETKEQFCPLDLFETDPRSQDKRSPLYRCSCGKISKASWN